MKINKIHDDNSMRFSEEFFEIRLMCDTETIDVMSLIKYLNQAQNMVWGINDTLNKVYCSGYDEIDVEVFALEHGSIRIPLKLKKAAKKAFWEIGITVIGGIAVNLMSGNKEPLVIVTPGGNAETDSSIFLGNRQTRRSVGNIAKMVAEDDGISDLSITYEKENGQRESITISKQTLENVAKECADIDEDTINMHHKVRLQIYGPILEDKPSSWWVKLNGQPFRAYMADRDFLKEMKAKRIAFAPDDEIIADLEEVISEDAKGKHTKWYIRKVHSYPKYTRITKHQK